MIDLDTMTLPNRLTASGMILGWGFQGWLSYLQVPTVQQVAGGILWAIFMSIFGLWFFLI